MKANRLFLSAALCLSALTSASAALAANPWPMAYDATYTIVDNHNGTATSRYLSNGTGRTRKETTLGQGKTVTIVDYPTKTVYTIMAAQKMIAKGPWKGDQDANTGAEIVDLGTSNVDGHICKGAECAVKGGIKSIWTDKKTNIMVRTIFKGSGTTRQTDMTAYAEGAPDAAFFELPSGYTIVAKP
jgi:hypothetical protein